MISIIDIYDKDVNFLFGSGASFGLLPTLQLQLKTGEGNARYTPRLDRGLSPSGEGHT